MSRIWLVTLNLADSRLDNPTAAFDSYAKALDFVCDAAAERWLGEAWYSERALVQAMGESARFGDSDGEYTINEMEVQ